jgi:signal transduction histidine kinase
MPLFKDLTGTTKLNLAELKPLLWCNCTSLSKIVNKLTVIAQDIGRVILNLITNAFYAVTERKKQAGDEYEPIVSVSTKKINGKVEIRVKDNGNRIPQKY